MNTYKIIARDADQFVVAGLHDEGSHFHTAGSLTPATLDILVELEAGTLFLESIEVSAFIDLGETPAEPDALPVEGSVVPHGAGVALCEQAVRLSVLDADGRPISNMLCEFASRTPQTATLAMRKGEKIMLPLGAQSVTLRLSIHGAVKRLSRVRAVVVASLADAPRLPTARSR